MNRIFLIALLPFLFLSCSIQKRHYMKGFYIGERSSSLSKSARSIKDTFAATTISGQKTFSTNEISSTPQKEEFVTDPNSEEKKEPSNLISHKETLFLRSDSIITKVNEKKVQPYHAQDP